MRTPFNSEDFWEVVDKGYEEKKISVKVINDVCKKDAKAGFFIQ